MATAKKRPRKKSTATGTRRTHIAVILDRTGSMQSIRDDTIGGFNTFLGEQQKLPGSATLTLVQFDSQDPYEVIHQMVPIKDVPVLTRKTYVPRSSTPLLDAMGRGINDLEEQLAKLTKAKKPDLVVFVVITDGQENASHEFRREEITRMIDAKKAEKWEFVFLSSDLDAVRDAGVMGVAVGATLTTGRSAQAVGGSFAAMSSSIKRARGGQSVGVNFTDEEREGAS